MDKMITKVQDNPDELMQHENGINTEESTDKDNTLPEDITDIIKTNSVKAAEIIKTYTEALTSTKSPNNDNSMDLSETSLTPEMYKIVETLTQNPEIQFKSQQRDEQDPTSEEKANIAASIFNKSKLTFLTRFGKHLNTDHLEMIRIQGSKAERDEIDLIITKLNAYHLKDKRKKRNKNRRYLALNKLIEEKSYFSDCEMMKRNPLLYDQLVGQYLSDEERRLRDRANAPDSFVKILMEGIERDNARDYQKKQEEEEDDAMEEEDSDSADEDGYNKKELQEAQASSSKWGEFMKDDRINKDEFYAKKSKICLITAPERQLLRDEFVTFMHQSFLDGKDEDFDYAKVDEDEELDNSEIVEHDEEEKYFDAEEPDDACDENKEESSEDELDIYMNALNQHPAVCALSNEMKKL